SPTPLSQASAAPDRSGPTATPSASAPEEQAPAQPAAEEDISVAALAASSPTQEPVATAKPAIPRASTPPPGVGARAYAIVERDCNALLWGQNERERLPPASLTKIVTALVAEEKASLGEMVDVGVSGSQMAKRGSSVMGLEPGMEVSVRDLLYGLFLPSGNDAALALAEHIGSNASDFADMMNDTAGRLGMNDSHFSNPHGLDSSALYSSALDMAIAGDAALDDPELAQISVEPDYKPAWDGPELRNGNKLLDMYPGAFGVKIGYTTKARQTIVAAAERDGRQIIVSLFGSENRYTDTIALFDWAFAKAPSAC
ncbi:MAG: hypothetical protein GEU75_14480, partial [Dehalococcoidia bacterium]|nr:hypothetical protein [Dehalococcoidia bacterium]